MAIMAKQPVCPVVQPLPKIVVKFGLGLLFLAGQALLWKDRFSTSSNVEIDNTVRVPAYK